MPVRPLEESERGAVLRLLDHDPYGAAVLAEHINARRRWSAGAAVYGYGERRRLESICWVGGHLTPVLASPPALAGYAEVLAGRPRGCSSVLGHADQVLPLWEQLAPAWGPARQVRGDQPLLLADTPPAVPADPGVRLARLDELPILWPAAAAMYTEEVGVPPYRDGGEHGHRSRIAELVRAGRAYLRVANGEVIFKADVAGVSRYTAQVQGVWVAPSWRGHGLATAAMAAVVRDLLRRLAPTVSLYVNDYNVPARRVYQRCGFRQVGTFATVLF